MLYNSQFNQFASAHQVIACVVGWQNGRDFIANQLRLSQFSERLFFGAAVFVRNKPFIIIYRGTHLIDSNTRTIYWLMFGGGGRQVFRGATHPDELFT